MIALERSLARALLVSVSSPLMLVAAREFRVAALLVAGGMFFAAVLDGVWR